jgi:hypothetical protein
MAYVNKSYNRKKNDRYDEDGLHAIGQHLDPMGIKVLQAQSAGAIAEMNPEDAIVVVGGILGGAAKPKSATVMITASIIRPKDSKESFEVADPDMARTLLESGGEYMGEKMVERQVSSGT